MNTQQNIRYLHKRVNDVSKNLYCLKQYVQDHSGGGGGEFNGISTTTSGNINFSGNGTTSDPLSANISLKTINGENIVGSGNISLPTYSNGTGLNLTGNQFSVIYGTTANTAVQGNDSRLHTHSNKAVIDGVTTTLVSNWNQAYSWGDHATQGYLKNIKTVNGQSLIGSGDVEINTFVEATPEISGIVKYDNTTIKKNNEGQLYVVDEGGYILPTATASTLGGIKVGAGLSVTLDGTLSTTGGGGDIPEATTTVFGKVKYDGVTIKKNSNGQLYTDSIEGYENIIEGVRLGDNLLIPNSSKQVIIPKANVTTVGVIKPDGLSIVVEADGTARALFNGVSTIAQGTYQQAHDTALANNHIFGWMLVDTLGGLPLNKIIWHIGDGVFVDSIGAVVEYELDPEPPVGEDFRFTVQLTDVNQEVYIPVIPGFTYNMTVDWGDGSPIETYNKVGVYKELKHTYLGMNGATFQIKIEGVCPNLRFDSLSANDRSNLKSIDNNTLPSLTNMQFTSNTNLVLVCANAWFNVTSPIKFAQCSNLTTIEHGFYQYTQGKGITEVSFSSTKLTDLENEFFTYINLSTANSLFRGTYLTYIPSSLKNALTNVTDMYYMFQGLNNDVTIPNDLFDLIPDGVLTDCRNAFAGVSTASLSKVKGDAKAIYDKLFLKSASGVQTAQCFSNNQMTNRNQVPTAWGGTLSAE